MKTALRRKTEFLAYHLNITESDDYLCSNCSDPARYHCFFANLKKRDAHKLTEFPFMGTKKLLCNICFHDYLTQKQPTYTRIHFSSLAPTKRPIPCNFNLVLYYFTQQGECRCSKPASMLFYVKKITNSHQYFEIINNVSLIQRNQLSRLCKQCFNLYKAQNFTSHFRADANLRDIGIVPVPPAVGQKVFVLPPSVTSTYYFGTAHDHVQKYHIRKKKSF